MPIDPNNLTRATIRAEVAVLIGSLGTVKDGMMRPAQVKREVAIDAPLLAILTPRTLSKRRGGGAPIFRRTVTLAVEAWATGATELAALVACDELLEAVEAAILTDDAFVQAFEAIDDCDTTIETDHEAGTRHAHGLLTVDVVWTEEFTPKSITESPAKLATVHIDVDVINSPATAPDGEIEHTRTISDLDL